MFFFSNRNSLDSLFYDLLSRIVVIKWMHEIVLNICIGVFMSVLNDPDGNPYSLLDNTETDQTADTDASDSQVSVNRRRRSRRRRTDEDTTVMDGMSESDNTSLSENGLGKDLLHQSSVDFILLID